MVLIKVDTSPKRELGGKDKASVSSGSAITVSDQLTKVLLAPCLIATFLLGRFLPGLTAFFTGSKLYTPANYVYDHTTVFDDTILTWGTDYILAITHTLLCLRILSCKTSSANSTLKSVATLLVASFALSTFCGAICHQFLYNKIDRWYFRLLWRICVGSVGAAGGAIGLCAGELAKIPLGKGEIVHFPVPVLPSYFWKVWGAFFFGVIWIGAYSMKNPACDIFLTGVTQAPPTLYLAFVLVNRSSWKSIVPMETIIILLVGLLSNCLLLPGYDFMNYLKLRDGFCNVFLHTVLFCSWSAQAVTLRTFVSKLEGNSTKQE